MNTQYLPAKRTRDLVAFFALAFAFSWIIGIPLALASKGITKPILPAWTHYLYAYGPMVAAILVTGASEGRQGLRELGSRMVKWNVRPIWWIVGLSPLLIGLAVALVLNAFVGSQISPATIGEVRFLPPLGLGALLLWIVTFGFGEETGWRGYALPRLQFGRSAFGATLVVWFFWALWHLPAFFYLYDPSIAPMWLIGQFAGAILFTWLFNSASGSILIVALWHGCFNFISSSQSGDGLLAAIVSTVVMIWAVVIVIICKPRNLSFSQKTVK